MFLLIILVQEVVVWILLYVQLSYFLVEYLAEFVDVLLVLCRDEEAVLIEFCHPGLLQVFQRNVLFLHRCEVVFLFSTHE